jgi:hypothetical protein
LRENHEYSLRLEVINQGSNKLVVLLIGQKAKTKLRFGPVCQQPNLFRTATATSRLRLKPGGSASHAWNRKAMFDITDRTQEGPESGEPSQLLRRGALTGLLLAAYLDHRGRGEGNGTRRAEASTPVARPFPRSDSPAPRMQTKESTCNLN